jgi:integrin beta 1
MTIESPNRFIFQAKLNNPCSVEYDVCSPAYGFRHHQRLSSDTEEFTDRVKEAPIAGNLDNAEGGLDALMQTIVCTEHIGWAPNSRKIVLLVTDGILHFAGDGLVLLQCRDC